MELENPQHIFHSHLLSHKCQWPVTIKNGLNEENVSPSFFFFFLLSITAAVTVTVGNFSRQFPQKPGRHKISLIIGLLLACSDQF